MAFDTGTDCSDGLVSKHYGMDKRRWLIIPPLIFLLMFLIIPVLYTFWTAFFEGEKSFGELISHIISYPLYRLVILNTLYISTLVTAATLLIAYPIAFLMAHSPPRRERIILTILVSSMWLSILIRSYAWTIMLQRQGPLNAFFCYTGVFQEPVSLMFSRFAVVIGMVHVLLPYMALVIWISLKHKGHILERVAYSFGATSTLYFFRIFLPLSRSGVAAGILLVLLLGFGFYITPALLGGGKGETMMIAMLIEEQMNSLGQWKMGSAISIVLLLVIFLLMVVIWVSRTTREALQDLFSGGTDG